jgi:RNA polymerase sigma-32 factor
VSLAAGALPAHPRACPPLIKRERAGPIEPSQIPYANGVYKMFSLALRSTCSVRRRWVVEISCQIRKFPMLKPEEEFAYAKRWREHQDRDAAFQLVTSHLRLVAKIAMRYRGYGLPIADIISEGNIGLMQAVKRFDPDRGVRLATCAM